MGCEISKIAHLDGAEPSVELHRYHHLGTVHLKRDSPNAMEWCCMKFERKG